MAQIAALLRPRGATVDEAAHRAATSDLNMLRKPTPAQAEAGNYAKGHVRVGGLDIAIENPAGSRRRPEWPPMRAHYGYVKATEGADGDHVDVFIRPGTPTDWAGTVYVIDQPTAAGGFDEHKCLLGFASVREAVECYLAHYPPDWRLGAVTPMALHAFRAWLRDGDTTRPVATRRDYAALLARLRARRDPDGIEKEFAAPAAPTSGLADYDIEGQKKGKRRVKLRPGVSLRRMLKWNPDQPRVPAGSPDGGQFGVGSGSGGGDGNRPGESNQDRASRGARENYDRVQRDTASATDHEIEMAANWAARVAIAQQPQAWAGDKQAQALMAAMFAESESLKHALRMRREKGAPAGDLRKYNPDQPRDELGRWSSDGGGGGSSSDKSPAAIESRLASKLGMTQTAEGGYVVTDRAAFQRAVAEYEQRAEEDSPGLGDRLLNTDIARELSPEYLADRSLSAPVHEPASAFIKELYAQKLAADTPDGRVPSVLFTAGGTGAGKSSGMRLAGIKESVARADIIYDTNMNTLGSADKKVAQALDSGRHVTIVYTHRDATEALVSGALPRAMNQERKFGTGRTVPLEEHAKTHEGALPTVRALQDRYNGDRRVDVFAVDNTRGRGNAATVDIKTLAPQSVSRQGLRDALETERRAGRISETVYRGFAGIGKG